jgi:DNA-binding transcriptional MocR family regulator
MNLNIDKHKAEPVYEQIRRQIIELVEGGLIQVGTRLPSVRQLALSLGISKNTVALAYAELAAQNVIETRHGAGAFVCAQPGPPPAVDLSRRQEMRPALDAFPPMRWEPYYFRSEFFGMPHSKKHSEVIRFTQANPDPALFPFERIKQVASNMLWYPQEFFFDIGNPQGYQPLVEHLEKEMVLAGVPMAEGQNDIILTGGFQRAVSLLLDFLLKPGQKVAIESPNYPNLLNLLIAKRIESVPVPVDSQGMDTEYLGGVLASGDVRAIITVPQFHNPTGVTMSQERREHLLRLSMQYRVPVIEDDWGRNLRYEGTVIPPLKALDTGGYVVHIGSYSKCFLPGLRIGWITCPAPISRPLLRAKLGADRGDSYFLQALLYDFIQKGHFDRHLRKIQKAYKARRDAMCRALAEHLPGECRFRVPQGGFSVWVELPAGMPSLPVLMLARAAGVDFLPAAFALPDRKDAPALRLSFARNSSADIEAGIRVLCSVLADCIERPELLQGLSVGYEDLFQ